MDSLVARIVFLEHLPKALKKIGGPCRIRTYNQQIMLTATAFAALRWGRSEFVVWTISSLYVSAI